MSNLAKLAVIMYDIYLVLLFLLTLLAVVRFKQLDRATKMIALLIFLSLTTELVARYFTKGNNHPVYNISCFIEWGLVCLYFNYSISSFTKFYLGWFFAIVGMALGILNLWLQPIEKLSSNFLFLECMGICCLSFYSVYRFMLVDDINIRLQRKVHYWIPFILAFYQCGALWSWVAYNYYEGVNKKATGLLHVLLILNCLVVYSAFAIVFYLYPKLRKTHV